MLYVKEPALCSMSRNLPLTTVTECLSWGTKPLESSGARPRSLGPQAPAATIKPCHLPEEVRKASGKCLHVGGHQKPLSHQVARAPPGYRAWT